MSGQVQVVPWEVLEQRLGRKLVKDEVFETKTGKWKVLETYRPDLDAYTIEKVG